MKVSILLLSALVLNHGGVESFVPTSLVRRHPSTSTTRTFMSDIPQDEPNKKQPRRTTTKRSLPEKSTTQEDAVKQKQEEWIALREMRLAETKKLWNNNNNNNNWTPEPPEDVLTFAGDIASLFLYAFMDHFVSDVYLSGVFSGATSAEEIAKTLDPSGTSIPLGSVPVWLDPTQLGEFATDQVLVMDLQHRVVPQFSTFFLSSAGLAAVSLATAWILAGLWHKSFHFRNTLDCSTHRAVAVTGQTWLTASAMLLMITCATHHLGGNVDTAALSASMMLNEGRIMSPIEEWFSVLTRADAEYICNGLGVVLTWRFLISYLMGGWSKK